MSRTRVYSLRLASISATNCEATVWNLTSRKKLTYSLLVPHMIERYGFYEGKGTSYRVEPRAVLQVFDFLKPAKDR